MSKSSVFSHKTKIKIKKKSYLVVHLVWRYKGSCNLRKSAILKGGVFMWHRLQKKYHSAKYTAFIKKKMQLDVGVSPPAYLVFNLVWRYKGSCSLRKSAILKGGVFMWHRLQKKYHSAKYTAFIKKKMQLDVGVSPPAFLRVFFPKRYMVTQQILFTRPNHLLLVIQ